MTVTLIPAVPPAPDEADTPRAIVAKPSAGDLIFRGMLRAAGISVLVITGMILVFLLLRSTWALKTAGFSFLTSQNWSFITGSYSFGIGGVLPDTIIIALIAMVLAIPVAVATAIFISEYAPGALRRPLIAVIDLMAAIPSIIYGLWGRFFLMPRLLGATSWLSRHLAAIGVFKLTVPGAAAATFAGAPVIAGLVVSLMVIPIITSLSREVFSQAPQGEREAAYALGSTRWGIGRALGETIAVLLIISPVYGFNWHILQSGGNSVAALIANSYREATPEMLSALMAAGLVLFSMTLVINSLAAIVINKSRSGAATAD
jgi:phosphate transport system permease protein